jgi:metallophosphoesterase (TIGR00282 family)
MKFLFLGDIVGKPGFLAVRENLTEIRRHHELDFVVANAENLDNGSGLTPAQFRELLDCGVNVVTLGDHLPRHPEIRRTMRESKQIVRPANFPPKSVGHQWTLFSTEKGSVAVVSLLGRVYMRPVDCPFHAADRVLNEIADQADWIVVDFHAEATGDKQLMGRYLDGRVTAVLGTHTHVPTADTMILPRGTAFQCDVGMCGPHESIIGRKIEQVLKHTMTAAPVRFHVASGDVRIRGVIVDAGPGMIANSIERFELKLSD